MKFGIVEWENHLYQVLDGELDSVMEEQSKDVSEEKHVPYIKETAEGYDVRIGKPADHPMGEEHYIQFIELIVDDRYVYRQNLNPGDEPFASFKVEKGTNVKAREYCNLHGLWKSEVVEK